MYGVEIDLVDLCEMKLVDLIRLKSGLYLRHVIYDGFVHCGDLCCAHLSCEAVNVLIGFIMISRLEAI